MSLSIDHVKAASGAAHSLDGSVGVFLAHVVAGGPWSMLSYEIVSYSLDEEGRG